MEFLPMLSAVASRGKVVEFSALPKAACEAMCLSWAASGFAPHIRKTIDGREALLNTLVWAAVAFFCGALPLSYWLGRIALHTDIRTYGDGNPGATNVWRAGGAWWGLLAVLLDFGKGLLPVVGARLFGLSGWALVPVALAPVIGHAYTPFLHFQGGKALAVTFGIWTGLTAWEIPTVLGISFAFWLGLFAVEGWAVLCGMLTLLTYLLYTGAQPYLLVVWTGTFLLFVWKHRTDFRRRPRPDKGLLRQLFRP